MQMTPMPWTFAHESVPLHVPVATVPEPQQGSPRAPHAVHAAGPAPGSMQRNPVLQVGFAAVPQHAWLLPPHATHAMPPSAATQEPPLWQMLPAQQAMPTAPHIMQMLGPVPGGFAQPRPVLHVLFAQHC